MKISKFSTLFTFILILISFSSCSQVVFEDLIQNRSAKSGVGGDIYGGKVYVHRMEEESCADGSNIKTMVVKDLDGDFLLAKNNCAPVAPALPIKDEEISYIDLKSILYNNEVLVEELSTTFESAKPKTLRDGQLFCDVATEKVDAKLGTSSFARAEVYGDSTSKNYFAKVAWYEKNSAGSTFYYADKLPLLILEDSETFLDLTGDEEQSPGENLNIFSSISRQQDLTGLTSYLKLNSSVQNIKLDLSCVGK